MPTCAPQTLWTSQATSDSEKLEFISMDFIEELPPSSGYTSILVIVDHLSKQSLFIPTHNTIMSSKIAQLFVLHIFYKHGVPSHVTSNHGTELYPTSSSPSELHDMKLHFTSRYHPEGDGQTNELIDSEQYLQVYVMICSQS